MDDLDQMTDEQLERKGAELMEQHNEAFAALRDVRLVQQARKRANSFHPVTITELEVSALIRCPCGALRDVPWMTTVKCACGHELRLSGLVEGQCRKEIKSNDLHQE